MSAVLLFHVVGTDDKGAIRMLGTRNTEREAEQRAEYWRAAGWKNVWIDVERRSPEGLIQPCGCPVDLPEGHQVGCPEREAT